MSACGSHRPPTTPHLCWRNSPASDGRRPPRPSLSVTQRRMRLPLDMRGKAADLVIGDAQLRSPRMLSFVHIRVGLPPCHWPSWRMFMRSHLMNASIVVAICATVIAVLSLAVSVYEARATRRHDRISVRPFLALRVGLRQGQVAGLQLTNAGLGPAAITKTVLTLDGESLGEFSELSVNELRSRLSIRPAAVTFRKTILATDYDQFLLSVDPFDPTEHAEFADLFKHRLGMEIHYESLYGGEDYKTERNPHPRPS